MRISYQIGIVSAADSGTHSKSRRLETFHRLRYPLRHIYEWSKKRHRLGHISQRRVLLRSFQRRSFPRIRFLFLAQQSIFSRNLGRRKEGGRYLGRKGQIHRSNQRQSSPRNRHLFLPFGQSLLRRVVFGTLPRLWDNH